MTTDEMIAVLRAVFENKEIEFRRKGFISWVPVMPKFCDFVNNEYRLKREPRVIYVNEHIGMGEIDRERCELREQDLKKGYNLRPVKFIEALDQ